MENTFRHILLTTWFVQEMLQDRLLLLQYPQDPVSDSFELHRNRTVKDKRIPFSSFTLLDQQEIAASAI